MADSSSGPLTRAGRLGAALRSVRARAAALCRVVESPTADTRGSGEDVKAVAARCESLAAALVTVLGETSPELDPSTVSVAVELADSTADLCALAAGWPAPQPSRAQVQTLLDMAHLLRRQMADHLDRLADLSNASVPPTPGTLDQVAQMRRLLERLLAELLRGTVADQSPHEPAESRGEP